jgi:Holliday junction resolvase RusA-like endonuclease
MRIEFFVRGLPGTKGSARAFVVGKKGGPQRAVMVNDAGEKAKTWASVVGAAAHNAMTTAPMGGPVDVAITWYLPRPRSQYWPISKAHPPRGDGSGQLRSDAPGYVSSKPDGDKLERCTWDALTKIVFTDDSRIVRWSGAKKYADPQPVGAHIVITSIGEELL